MYSKYPNQVMKIICPSVLMLDALMYGFYLSYLKKNCFGSVLKCSISERNCDE